MGTGAEACHGSAVQRLYPLDPSVVTRVGRRAVSAAWGVGSSLSRVRARLRLQTEQGSSGTARTGLREARVGSGLRTALAGGETTETQAWLLEHGPQCKPMRER